MDVQPRRRRAEPVARPAEDDDFAYDSYVYTSGTGADIPTLVLPVDQTIQFNLHSPDVIHDFGVPSFLVKMDVIPGRVNKLQVTPTVEGTYAGKCYELCGVSHSRMLFNVEVVSQEEYDAYLLELADAGNTAEQPAARRRLRPGHRRVSTTTRKEHSE